MPIARVTFGASFGLSEDYADDYFAEGYTQVSYSGSQDRFETWTELKLATVLDALRSNPILHDFTSPVDDYTVHYEKFDIDEVNIDLGLPVFDNEKLLTESISPVEKHNVLIEKPLYDQARITQSFMVSHDMFDSTSARDHTKFAFNKNLRTYVATTESLNASVVKPLRDNLPVTERLHVGMGRPLGDSVFAVDRSAWSYLKPLTSVTTVDDTASWAYMKALSDACGVGSHLTIEVTKSLYHYVDIDDTLTEELTPNFEE